MRRLTFEIRSKESAVKSQLKSKERTVYAKGEQVARTEAGVCPVNWRPC